MWDHCVECRTTERVYRTGDTSTEQNMARDKNTVDRRQVKFQRISGARPPTRPQVAQEQTASRLGLGGTVHLYMLLASERHRGGPVARTVVGVQVSQAGAVGGADAGGKIRAGISGQVGAG